MLKNWAWIIYKRKGLRWLLYFMTFCIWQSLETKAEGTSYDKELEIIPIRQDCSTVQPIATYSFNNGETRGVFYATACRHGSHLPSLLVDYVKINLSIQGILI